MRNHFKQELILFFLMLFPLFIGFGIYFIIKVIYFIRR
jgi:zona occludens toxin (predicted ATPase)